MQSFTDAKNRSWEISVNAMSAERVKKLTDIDVIALADDGWKPLFALKPNQCVMILYALLKPNLDDARISADEFGESMVGDVLQGGIDAFQESLIDFFPDRQTRTNLRLLIKKGKAAEKILMDRAEKELTGLEPEKLAEEVRKVYQNRFGSLSGSVAESSESIPDPSLSVSSLT